MGRFILYIFIFCNSLFALESLPISTNVKIEKINQPLYFVGNLSSEEVYEKFKKGEFEKLSDKLRSLGLFNTSFWISLEILNPNDENLFLSFVDVSIEKATLYKYQNDVLIETKQSGLLVPRVNNNLENFVPKFHLEKSPISYTYLIKIDSSIPFWVEILIGNNSDIINALVPEIGILFILLGSLLSLFFYNVFLYLSTKENDYALYSIYIVFLVSWIFSFHGYFTAILGFNIEIKNIIKVFTLLCTSLFLLLFSFKFLDIQNRYLKKWCYIFLVIAGVYFIRTSFSYFTSMIILIFVTSFCLYLGIQKFIQGYSSSKYFVLALCGYLIGIIISFCMFEIFLEANFYTLQAQLIGTIWVMIFLSLALGHKLSLIQLERNNAILKAQVQEKILFLQSRQASVGELVGNITHQWREPLAEIGAIQTNLHATLLIKGVLTKEKILDSIEQSSGIIRHLSDTIDVFYRFFKHEKSNKSEFSIVDIIHDIRKMVHYILEVENISFLFEYKDEIYLFGDRNEFANAIINIILNAKDILVERKIVNPYIKININQISNAIIITIEDNAGGIKEEPFDKIFESCISSKSENIGIGLYIVKTIIEKRFGGKIDVKNNEFGAIFTISLPLNNEITQVNVVETDLNMEESTLDRIYRLERKVEKQVELEKTLRQWEDIFEQTHWAVSVHNGKNNKFEMVNPAFYTLYGYSKKELQYMKIENLFSPSSLNILYIKQKEAFEKCFSSFEATHLRKDGSSFPVNIDLTVIKNENGDILYHIANIRDISEQKKANQRLLLKKFALDHIHEAVHLMNEEGKFKYVNKGACRALGYSESELLELNIGDVDADWPIERWHDHWSVIKQIKTMTMELRHKRKDGTIFPVEVLANYFEYEGVAYNMALARDITERKAIQENILLKEFALNKVNESVFLIDENARFHYVNEAACKGLGYEDTELLQLNIMAIDPSLSQEKWLERWNKIKHDSSAPLFLSYHQRKDGTVFPIEVSANAFEYKGITYNLAITRNITEQLLLEKQKDNERMRLFFERQLVGMAITSPEKGWLEANDKLCEIMGYSFAELQNMTWVELTHIDDLAGDLEEFEKILRGEIEHYFYEKRFIKKSGEIIFTNLSIGCVRKDTREVDYLIVLIEDITERKNIEEALIKREQELRLLADSSPGMMGSFYLRPDGSTCMPYVSPNILDIFGLEPTDVREDATALFTLIHPSDIDLVIESIDESANTMSIWHEEYRIIHPIKGERWLESNTKPELHPAGGIIWYGHIHDITERKHMEVQLLEQNRFLDSLLNAIPVPIFYKDTESRYKGFNKAFEEFYGKRKEDLIGKGVYDLFPLEQAQVFFDADEDLFLHGGTQIYETKLQDIQGINHDVIFHKAVYSDNAGTVIGQIGTILDISERKIQEELLRQKEEESHTLLNNMPGYVYTLKLSLDGELNFIYLSAGVAEIYGLNMEYSFEDMVSNIHASIDADYLPEIEAKIIQSSQELTPFFVLYSIHHPVDGKKWIEARAIPKKLEDGTVIWHGIVLDVTERKELESLLEKERKFLVDAQRVGHTGSWYLDIENNLLSWSDETYRIFELDKENTNDLHKTFYEIVHPDDKEIVNAPYLESLKTRVPYEIEHRIIVRDGRIKYVIERCEHVYDNDGKALYSIGTVQDISERKFMEKELADSYNFLNQLVDSIPDPVFVKNKEHNWVLINEAFCLLINQPRELLLGKSDFDFFPKEEADIFKNKDEIVFQSHEININEEKFTDSNGITHDIQTIKTVFVSGSGDEYLVGTIRDITERKQAEDAIQALNETLEIRVQERTAELREREGKFYNLFKLSPAAVSITSLDRKMYLEVNESFLYHTEYTQEEVIGHSSAELNLFANPDDRAEFFQKVMKDGVVYDFEYPFQSKSGKIGYATVHGAIMTLQGEQCLLAHSYDITSRKEAEIALLQSEEAFRAIVENSPDVIMRYDLECYRVYVNPIGLRLLNKSLEEVIGKKPNEYSPLFDTEEFNTYFQIAIKEKKEQNMTVPFRMPDQSSASGEIRIIPELVKDKVTSILVIGRDITQLKKYEATINNLNKDLEQK